MNLRNVGKYGIGLDLGTNSVGWAVIDDEGELLHFRGKPTWGSRLFQGADPASVARVNRGQRRRYDRRRQRLNLLQGFFCEPMQQVDPDFFIRLNQARLLPEDRDPAHNTAYRWPLFNDQSFTEVDYYQKFPTIYHLRTWLMETPEQADLRLIYLALHNIVKTRGNFLWQEIPNLSAKNANAYEAVQRLVNALQDYCAYHDLALADDPDMPALIQALSTPGSRQDRQQAVKQALRLGKELDKMATAIAKSAFGYVAKMGDLFAQESLAQSSFSLDNDDNVEDFLSKCPDDAHELFDALRMVRSAVILMGILEGGDGRTISYHKVDEYDRYGRDLKTLKELVRAYVPEHYNEFFRGAHYEDPRWAHDYDPDKAKGYTRYNLKRSQAYDDFRKEVEKLFKGTTATEDPRYAAMMAAFAEERFLRRLKTSDNGSIPYQLHLEEMRAIIANQGQYYPFLLEEQAKLESLVSFRIPYYVGPLTQKNAAKDAKGNNRFAWSVRVEGKQGAQPIRPWNWEEVIDKDASAEAFIRRMTGTCTYLYGEPVLPKSSLLYERYCVLNELNGARYSQDGDKWYRFSYDDRQGIITDLFERRGSVSYKAVADWLKKNGRAINPRVRGGQGEAGFESKLSSHRFFTQLLGIEELSDTTAEMVENIILWNTLFEDRDILRQRLRKSYGDLGTGQLSPEQIGKIVRKRFTGWGRFSKALLTEVRTSIDGRSMSIMDVLDEGAPTGKHLGSALVFMEILHDETLGFEKLINERNKEHAGGGLAVEDLPGSPALRRSVNQALRIVDEIVKIAGHAPSSIYIETTRDDEKDKKGRRTTRRYDAIKQALTALKAENAEAAETLGQLARYKPQELNDDALVLYFMQNGKCMYSGEPLDIHLLSTYQIDHIIPQSYIKDDSFENRVLVLPDKNQAKSDQLLIAPEIRQHMAPLWRELHKAGLIGDKKFNNLMRREIGEQQMRGFIARQLVETSQVVKYVRMMLEERYADSSTKVRSIKASLSHQLREAEHYVKCREANDFHHAHDALLAAEVGRFIEIQFGNVFDKPILLEHAMREYVRSLNDERKRIGHMPGDPALIVGSFRRRHPDPETGEIIWDGKAECDRIRHYLNYRDCYISHMPEIKSGKFWDATIYSPKNASKAKTLPLKANLPADKYGTYSGVEYAYFFIYEVLAKKKKKLIFAGLPVNIAQSMEGNPQSLDAYAKQLAETDGQTYLRLVRSFIPTKQLFEVDGCLLYVAGLTWGYCASQYAFTQQETDIILRLADPSSTNAEERLRLYDSLSEKVVRYSSFHSGKVSLSQNREKFIGCSLEEQATLLRGIIDWANAKTNKVNLTAIGGAANGAQQKITYNKELNVEGDHFVLIDQSVTGMFERKTRIGL